MSLQYTPRKLLSTLPDIRLLRLIPLFLIISIISINVIIITIRILLLIVFFIIRTLLSNVSKGNVIDTICEEYDSCENILDNHICHRLQL